MTHLVRRILVSLTLASFGLLAACSQTTPLEQLESEIPGFFPKRRYYVQGPSLKPAYLKIAYVRKNAYYEEPNPYTRLLPLRLLPIPYWNKGLRNYKDSTTELFRQPEELFQNRFATIIVENPRHVNDYDIIVEEKVRPGTSEKGSLFWFWFLFYNEKHTFPPIDVTVSSDFGLAMQKEYGPFTKRTFQLILPFYMKDTRNSLPEIFTTQFYKALKNAAPNPFEIVYNRRRKVIFETMPNLQKLEALLVEKGPARMTPAVYKKMLHYYKMAFDLGEHQRILREMQDIETVIQQAEANFASAQAAHQQQNNDPFAMNNGSEKRMQQSESVLKAILVNRLRPSIGLIDVTFGCNYVLYHEDLRDHIYYDEEYRMDEKSLDWMQSIKAELEPELIQLRKQLEEARKTLQTTYGYAAIMAALEQMKAAKQALQGILVRAIERQEHLTITWLQQEEAQLPSYYRAYFVSLELTQK